MRLKAFLAIALASSTASRAGDEPPPAPTSRPAPIADDALDARLLKLEAMNRAIMDRLERSERDREEADARYRDLESRYDELRTHLGGEAEPAHEAEAESPRGGRPSGRSRGESPNLLRPDRFSDLPSDRDNAGEGEDERFELPLKGLFSDEGFGLTSRDDEYQFRFRVLDQTDFKAFVPGNQVPAASGLYIPRVRLYLEGRLTRWFDYEVSIQRSVEGVWDLLDGNVDVNFSERLRLKFGRTLVPYSYDWYDHLEQYFITPERSLFPLNFGLSRSAGLMAHGHLFDRRLQYAVGGFDGHLTGVADENTTRDAVAYFNARPFLQSERFPMLRYLNLGVSGYLGQQVLPQAPLPLRTSLQSSENDEAASRATSVFLIYNEDAYLSGPHSAMAAHLAWYAGGLSFEAEWQGSRDHYTRSKIPFRLFSVPATGSHFSVGYFVTGEKVRDRSRVDPLRPFDPTKHSYGPGAVELFARYSELQLNDEVFRAGLADPRLWTNGMGMTDIGLNWYLNSYIKIYLDWQRSYYDTPVQLNPTLRSLTNDLFWIRAQLYY